MSKSTVTKLLIIVLAFTAAGLGFGIPELKEYILDEALDALQDEVRESCDCVLKYDRVELSLLSRTARGVNVRIESNGKPALSFPSLTVRLDLSKARRAIVILEEVELDGGFADGVGPDSPTFKFIDHLTAAPVPGAKSPLIKVELNHLTLKNTSAREPLSGGELLFRGVDATVAREKAEDFRIVPVVRDFSVHLFGDSPGDEGRILPLGKLVADVLLEGDIAHIKGLEVRRDTNVVRADATADISAGNALTGEVGFLFALTHIGLPEWLSARIEGSGSAAGTLGGPRFSVDLSRPADAPDVGVVLGGRRVLDFPRLAGHADIAISGGTPSVILPQLSMSGEGRRLESERLNLVGDRLDSAFHLTMDRFVYDNITLEGLDARFSPAGSLGDIRTAIEGSAANLLVSGTPLGHIDFAGRQIGDDLEISVSHTSPDRGVFKSTSTVNLATMSIVTDYSLDDFAPLALAAADNPHGPLATLRASGKGSLSGPIDLMQIRGNADLAFTSPFVPESLALSGKLAVDKGLAQFTLAPPNAGIGTVNFGVKFGDRIRGAVDLGIRNLPLTMLLPRLPCGETSFDGKYEFDFASPLRGDGSVQVHRLDVGCDAYALTAPQNITLPIKSGALILHKLTLSNPSTPVNLDGSISPLDGFSLKASGGIWLGTLISALPALDELSGSLQASIELEGPLAQPRISGTAQVKKVQLAIESANVGIADLEGAFRLDGDRIAIEKLEGIFNGGKFWLDGTLFPFDPAQSRVEGHVRRALLDPVENISLEVSGDIGLRVSERGQPLIEGDIRLESGEFQKNFSLASIVRSLSQYFASSPGTAGTQGPSTLPPVELGVRVLAPKNLFLVSNLFGAELSADLEVRGTLGAPVIRGGLETLSGWVGIRDRRFEITSGRVQFQPRSLEPIVDITAESQVRSPTGENILVVIQVTGPPSKPRIELTSDSGLSERELLTLISNSGSLTGLPLLSGSDSLEQTLLSPLEILGRTGGLGDLLRTLTKIDSVSLEPTFSFQTGSLEPAIVAEKTLTRRLKMVALSFLGGSVNESRLGALYNINSVLTLSGLAETVSTRQNTTFGVDLAYTILSSQLRALEVSVHGLRKFSRDELLSGVRLLESSRLQPEAIDGVLESVRAFYRDNGYLTTSAVGKCIPEGTRCGKLELFIDEGRPSKVREIRFEGESFPGIAESVDVPLDALATADRLAEAESTVLRRLRADGYLSARVSTHYAPVENMEHVALTVTTTLGKPVSFVFAGNTVFSAREFLDTINLFGRKRSFGNNTISILVQNMERLYQSAGYLYATIGYERDEDPSTGRTTYRVTINEGNPAPVKSVEVVGNESLKLETISALYAERQGKPFRTVLKPRFVVPDEIQANVKAIEEIYIEEGYPAVDVAYDVLPAQSDNGVNIRYRVAEGAQYVLSSVSVSGIPSSVTAAAPPEPPLSIPRVNRYLEQMVETLSDRGYLSSSLETDSGETESAITAHVTPGPLTVISGIQIEGLDEIHEPEVLSQLKIGPGSPWDKELLLSSKRALIRRGLFSQVELLPADGKVDSEQEELLIRITERPLRTLKTGGGLNTEFGLHLFGEATDKQLFRDGKSLTLRLDTFFDSAQANGSSAGAGVSQGVASVRFFEPSVLSSPFSLAEELRYQRQDLATQEYNLDRVSLGSSIFRSYEDRRSTTFGHTILQENLDSVSPDAVLSKLDEGTVTLSFLDGAYTYDRRNEPFSPTEGFNITADYKLSSKAIASDADFISSTARMSYLYTPVSVLPDLTFASSTRIGGAFTYGSTEEIPITQRFYLGGRSSIRGFRENSLGPRGAQGAVLGGDRLFAQNFEVQYRVAESVSVLTFFDAGNVFLDESIALGDLRRSVGIGFRFLSPLGPVGFDIGHPLDEKAGEPSLRAHFLIGSRY